MINKLILSGFSIAMIVIAYLLLSSQNHAQTLATMPTAEGWPPFVAQYREEGTLSFIWDMEPGSQIFVLDYTDVQHWTRTILSSTVKVAEKASATLDGNILITSSPMTSEIYTETIETGLGPNEWLSYGYLSNLQKKPTVVIREGPEPGLVTAVETFERPCFPLLVKEGVIECGKDQKNSVVTREFTYRAEDYILTKLVSKVDGAVVEEVTLENLTFK